MKQMAWSLVAVALLAGCVGSSASTEPPPVGGGGAGNRPPTTWPRGDDAPPATRQPYPFVLAHGLDGFKSIGSIDYFYGVADALRKDGRQVFVSQVDSYNSSEVRGAELQAFVIGVLAQTGAKKVNLICHSQGGFDCRYVASNLGNQIASVTTIATPHHGTPIADIAEGDLPGPLTDAVNAFLDVLGAVVDGLSGQEGQADAKAALLLMTTQGAADFTQNHPDSPNVAYFSVAGRTDGTGDDACGSATEVPFIAKYDGVSVSPSVAFAASEAIIAKSFNPPPTNDGLVPAASARWGTFLGCLPADHLGEMCWKSGAAGMDCVQFYRDLASWLVGRGF
jgi:triacylglycerol lipase